MISEKDIQDMKPEHTAPQEEKPLRLFETAHKLALSNLCGFLTSYKQVVKQFSDHK